MSVEAPKNYFWFHLTTLRCVGINIHEIKNPILSFIYNVYAVAFITFSFVGFTVFEFMAVLIYRKDIDTFTFIICYWISHFMGCLKGAIFLVNRKAIKKYLLSFEEGVFKPDIHRGGEEEINIIKRGIQVSNIQANLFFFMGTVGITNRVIYAWPSDSDPTETIYDSITNTTITSIVHTLPWYTWFWFDTTTTPYYQFAFFYQVWCVSIFGVQIGILDTLVSAMLVHLNAQFRILNYAILTITDRAKKMMMEETGTQLMEVIGVEEEIQIFDEGYEKIPRNNRKLDKYLDICVNGCLKHHRQIIELSNNVEEQFNLMVLVQVLGSTLIICFQLFQLSNMTLFSTKFMNMSIYFMMMIYQLAIYCYNGNEITLQSLEISMAAYNTDWFGAEDSLKKKLILMMLRAQRPIKMSAGKFAFLSLETFMNIVRGSVSYYMVLNGMST